MVNTVDLLGVVFILASFIILPVIYFGYKNRKKLTGIWILTLALAIFGVSNIYGLKLLFDDYQIVTGLDNLKYVFLNVMEISFLFLVIEYTRNEKLRNSVKIVPPAIILIIFVQAIVWFNPYNLFRGPDSYVDANGLLQNEFGVLFYLVASIGYIFVILGFLLLVEKYISSRGIYKKQCLILIIAVIIGSIFNIAYSLDLTYIDLSPVGVIVISILVPWAIFRYQFLEMIPVAREEIIDTMDDAAIVLNNDGRVIDINKSGIQILSLDNNVIGENVSDIFSKYSFLLNSYKNYPEAQDEISLDVNGEERHFDLNISRIEDNTGEMLGQIIVLRDITELKNHEKEIELLKDVQSRVLRHNLRNELGLIRGWAEAFQGKYPEDKETFSKMMEIVDKIIDRGEKARTIERMLDRSEKRGKMEVTQFVEDAIMLMWNKYPDVEFRTEMPEEAYVYAVSDIDTAIKNLVENAAEHNDAEDPWVEVRVVEREEWVDIEVEDNGPGIPKGEIQIIEEGEETPLRHGSGVGLWLVDYVVNKCNGKLSFDTDGPGSLVTIRLRNGRRGDD